MDIKGIIQYIKDYCKDNKRNAILFASLIVCIILLIILLASIPHGKKNKKTQEKQIVLTEQLLVPDGPEIHRDYNISRQTKDKWDEEQASAWFEIPGLKDIDSLEKANDNIISDITGAAP